VLPAVRRDYPPTPRIRRACAASAAGPDCKSAKIDILYPEHRKISMRVFNFSAGPAVLPESVLKHAAAEMLDWRGSGIR